MMRLTHLLRFLACIWFAAAVAVTAGDAQAAEPTPTAAAPAPSATNAFSTIYRFLGARQADFPRGGVAIDTEGNIYGTTYYDGLCTYCGVLYTLIKPAAGQTAWTYKILHAFGANDYDGIGPVGPLLFKNNVIYGTTAAGADPNCGCGEVFKLTKSGTSWTYAILHRFNRTQGTTPNAGVLLGPDGSLYGTASAGGSQQYGVLYRLAPGGAFTVLHTFAQTTGATPQGELIFGKDGAIYGTGFGGGKSNQGVVFRITTAGAYSVVYNFLGVNQPGGSHDGADPEGRIALDSNGTIYGTTTFGGTPSGYGTAWSLTPPATAGQAWAYKQLYIFGESPNFPNLPHSGLVRDAKGRLYGVGAGGGTYGGGVLYRLNPPATGSTWTETNLRVFIPRNAYGDSPYADLLLSNGTLYGTTLVGGAQIGGNCENGCGTVFIDMPPT